MIADMVIELAELAIAEPEARQRVSPEAVLVSAEGREWKQSAALIVARSPLSSTLSPTTSATRTPIQNGATFAWSRHERSHGAEFVLANVTRDTCLQVRSAGGCAWPEMR